MIEIKIFKDKQSNYVEQSNGDITIIKPRIENYIKSRKSPKSIKYSYEIIIAVMSYCDVKGIRSIDLMNCLVPKIIPDSTTYFRIIKELSSDRFQILKETIDHNYKGGGKKPVYYSAPNMNIDLLSLFKTKDEIWKELVICQNQNNSLTGYIKNLENILNEEQKTRAKEIRVFFHIPPSNNKLD